MRRRVWIRKKLKFERSKIIKKVIEATETWRNGKNKLHAICCDGEGDNKTEAETGRERVWKGEKENYVKGHAEINDTRARNSRTEEKNPWPSATRWAARKKRKSWKVRKVWEKLKVWRKK